MKNKKLTSVLVMMMAVIIMLCTFCLPASAATAISKTTITYTHNYTYTGKAIKPAVTVKNGKKKLTAGKNYTVAYKNNKAVGKATITITGKGSYTGKATKYFYIKPKAVTSLKATAYAEKIKLTWGKVTGAKGYQVQQKIDGKWTKIASPTGTSYTVTGLDGATKYEFRVRAYAKTGDKTLYSAYKTVSKTTTIGKVSGIASSDITDSTAKLTWNKVKGATSYRVVFINTSTSYKRTVTAASNSVTLTSLDALSAYSVKITAVDVEKGLSGAESAEFKFSTAPAAVRNLTATLASDTVVNLSWKESFGAEGYQVYYSKVNAAGNPTNFVQASFVTGTSCSLSSLTPCSTYIFKVIASVYTDNGTVYSKETLSGKITMPVPKIYTFKGTTMSSDSVALSWSRPLNISGYTLYKDGVYLLTFNAQTTSYTVTGLSAGSSYKFEICAFVTDIDGKKTEGEKTAVTISTSSDTVQSIAFNGRPSSLKVGGTYQLSVKVTPESASNKSVTYSSSNTSVATVSSSGLITALKAGTTKIKAVSVANPSKEVSFELTVTTAPVENIKVQSISLDPSITIYEGDIVSLNPEITPADATDKGYTITSSDYSYQYKEFVLGGLLGTTTKTDVCKFSDYIDVYSSSNLIRGRKATIEPKNETEFSFTVTVKTTDGSNKTATTKVKVLPKLIDVKYIGMEDLPWYYGNSAQLTATLHSSLQDKYKASDIRFKSSDTSIATVTNDGTVTCKGTGNVTITAYIPSTSYTGTFTFYSRGIVSIGKNYYDSCKVGKSYQLDARILPYAGDDEIVYYSDDEDVATVDSNGLVTFKTNGNVMISIFTDSDPFNYQQIWLTTNTFQTPSGTTSQLLSKMKTSANAVKNLSNLPSVTRYDQTTMSNFTTTSKDISASELQGIFNSELTPRTTYLQSASSSSSDFSVMKGKFIDNVPVKGQSYIIKSDLSEDNVKSINVKDNGDYFYEMELTLKDEFVSTLPSPNNTTNHGKVFDILTSDYITTFINEINSTGTLEIKYSSFSQRYYNSKLTLKINKVTGNLESANFDMTLDGSVKNLEFKYGKSFTMDVTFTCNNIVNINFSSYAE